MYLKPFWLWFEVESIIVWSWSQHFLKKKVNITFFCFKKYPLDHYWVPHGQRNNMSHFEKLTITILWKAIWEKYCLFFLQSLLRHGWELLHQNFVWAKKQTKDGYFPKYPFLCALEFPAWFDMIISELISIKYFVLIP